MADIKNIKIGSSTPDSLMYDKYTVPDANELLSFKTLIDVDNSNDATLNVVTGQWQVNDGWEVEIINSKKIAIKKFKIDTWGLRMMITANTDLYTATNSFTANVSGLSYVNNNVVCHTSGSNVPDGFTKAYGGSSGYNVYWYPGQFDSGGYMQGLVIQKGIGYVASDNERTDSLQIGKHPWDVYKSCINDTTVKATWGDSSYRAVTIGLYGGVQNASSWHDETGEAYKQYDISDHPIYIDLKVEDWSKGFDPSTQECWDAYCGDTQIYHKDKTVDNYLKKYDLVFPIGWNIYNKNFTSSDYVTWVSPTKMKVVGVPSDGIVINLSDVVTTANYTSIKLYSFAAKLLGNVPDGVIVKVGRTYTNVYTTSDYTSLRADEYITLSKGNNTIPEVNTIIYKVDSDISMKYNKCSIKITAESTVDSCEFYIQFVTNFDSNELLELNTYHWNDTVYLHPITDLENYITKMRFNCHPYNSDFWDDIKAWFANNSMVFGYTDQVFRGAINLDEITVNLPDHDFLTMIKFLYCSSVKKITIIGTKASIITSAQALFEGAGNLTEIVIETPNEYLCTANDVNDMFNYCSSLSTYPANMIRWDYGRTQSDDYSLRGTNFGGFAYSSNLVTIPAFGNDETADSNIMLPIYFGLAFYGCTKLTSIGFIIDLCQMKPSENANCFYNCTALTTAKIKNLNHGDWVFDGTDVAGYNNGNLSAFSQDSIEYLFDNLVDLTTYDANKSTNNINTSFWKWSSGFILDGVYDYYTAYQILNNHNIYCKKRYTSLSDCEYIIYSNNTSINCSITIHGMQSGDTIYFGTKSSPDYTITEDGTYTIENTQSTYKGFILIGDSSETSQITITLNNYYDTTSPAQSSANLYCPSTWEDYITDDMITAANTKGWSIYIGGTIKTV